MDLRRLSWAGLAITHADTTILIDPLVELTRMLPILGEPHEPFVPITPQSADAVLLTHLHFDHYSTETVRQVLKDSGQVVCHAPVAAKVAADGFAVLPVALGQPQAIGELTVTAVPAVDGFGDDQVSWVVSDGARRIIHCGDTLWHGHWRRIQRAHGPFDLACVPINGAIVDYPTLNSHGIPAVLTPEQAAAAAVALGASAVCPIHYGLINTPPIYTEHPGACEALTRAAAERNLLVRWAQPGEVVTWA